MRHSIENRIIHKPVKKRHAAVKTEKNMIGRRRERERGEENEVNDEDRP